MVTIIGGGKMGSAIASGLLARNFAVTIVERNESDRQALTARFPQASIVDHLSDATDVIVAVKPKDATSVVSDAVSAGAQRIVSIAAGITLARLQSAADPTTVVFRAMPNLGALTSQSATAVCWRSDVDAADIDWVHDLIDAFGTVVDVEETQMDAITGLSGSGPAYVFLMTEALTDAGVNAGLTREVAAQLAVTTVQGAASLLDATNAVQLRQMVTTPNGTTAAGVAVLESQGLRDAFNDAVAAAAQRSRELGVESQRNG
jgi:pyrroline-5-carboxylate reductase